MFSKLALILYSQMVISHCIIFLCLCIIVYLAFKYVIFSARWNTLPLYTYGKIEDFTDEDKEGNSIINRTKILLSVFVLLIIINIIIPSRSLIITYVALKEIDNYNSNNKRSMLNVDGFLKISDKVLNKLSVLLENDSEIKSLLGKKEKMR